MNKKIAGWVISLMAAGAGWAWLAPDRPTTADASQSPVAPHPWLSPSSAPVLPSPGPLPLPLPLLPAASSVADAGGMPDGPQVSASVSMAEARVHGDDRAPPIEPPTQGGDGPAATAWEMSDPARYQSYEQGQQQRVYAAYARAADGALTQWRARMAEARERGVSAQALSAGEEKIKKLEAMQAALARGGALAASAPP